MCLLNVDKYILLCRFLCIYKSLYDCLENNLFFCTETYLFFINSIFLTNGSQDIIGVIYVKISVLLFKHLFYMIHNEIIVGTSVRVLQEDRKRKEHTHGAGGFCTQDCGG